MTIQTNYDTTPLLGDEFEINFAAALADAAAAGELAEHPSNDPRAADQDNKLAVTTCAVKTRVSQGKGCEGGAACLRRYKEVGKPIPETSRAGAGASAGRITSLQGGSYLARHAPAWRPSLAADMGVRHAKLPFAKSEARAHYFNVLSIAWTHCGAFF